MAWKIVAALPGGLLFAFMGLMVIGLSGLGPEGGGSGLLFWSAWAVGAAVALVAPSAGKSWRYILICCALMALAMPLSSLIFTSGHITEASARGAGASAGAVIGGGMATAMTGLVGFFLAAIFLIVGLLVGRDKPGRQ